MNAFTLKFNYLSRLCLGAFATSIVLLTAQTAFAKKDSKAAFDLLETDQRHILRWGSTVGETASLIDTGDHAVGMGGTNFGYEYMLHSSFGWTFDYQAQTFIAPDSGGRESGIATGFRWYINGSANSWFLAARVGASSGERVFFDRNDEKSEYVATGFGELTIGYRWVWRNGLNISLGFGPGYQIPFTDNLEQGFHPAGDLTFGFAF